MDLAAARHALLGAPLAEFVSERARLAAQLKAAGKKQDAAALLKLRKPPSHLWALNQVARREPALVEAMLQTGEQLVALHAGVAHGQAAAGFRETAAAHRRTTDAVIQGAQALLRAAGHAADAAVVRRLQQTVATLHLAPPERRDAARAGDLDEEQAGADVFAAPDSVPVDPDRRVAALRAVEETAAVAARAQTEVANARVAVDAGLHRLAEAQAALMQAHATLASAEAQAARAQAAASAARATLDGL